MLEVKSEKKKLVLDSSWELSLWTLYQTCAGVEIKFYQLIFLTHVFVSPHLANKGWLTQLKLPVHPSFQTLRSDPEYCYNSYSAWYSRYKLVVMATATIRCPGCGQEIMRGAAVECNFKPSVQATTFQQSFDRAQERHWLCMECKYIVENRYGDMSSVTSEDAYTLLYSVRIKKGSNCCNSCTII